MHVRKCLALEQLIVKLHLELFFLHHTLLCSGNTHIFCMPHALAPLNKLLTTILYYFSHVTSTL